MKFWVGLFLFIFLPLHLLAGAIDKTDVRIRKELTEINLEIESRTANGFSSVEALVVKRDELKIKLNILQAKKQKLSSL